MKRLENKGFGLEWFVFILVMLIPKLSLFAQQDSLWVLETVIDNYELQMEDLEDIENISEELLERMEMSQMGGLLNLNDLSYEQAVNQLQLSDYQYYQLQLYIEEYGQLYSIYELDAIEGFMEKDRLRLAVLAVIGPPPKSKPTFKELWKASKSVLWVRYGQVVERQAGYDTTRANHYEGSPAHVQFRYDYHVRQYFGFRIAGEKDAGEPFFRGEQKYGFDHYSGSVYVKNLKWLKCAVLGDYRLNFGQGLVLGSSMMSGKGGDVSTIRRFAEGVRPVATTNESELFRGGAVTLGNSKWLGSLFVGDVTETNSNAFGGAVSYRRAHFSVGLHTVCFGDYADTALAREKWQALFCPKHVNAGLSYHAVWRKQLFFGEMAVNEKGKVSMLHTAVFTVNPVFRFATLVRYYTTGYEAPMGRAFRVTSGDCGEFGTYLAGHLVLSRKVETDFFFDYYRLLWLSYQTDAPIQGVDGGMTLTCRLSRKSTLMMRYQWRSKPKNASGEDHLRRLAGLNRHRIRLQWSNEPFPLLKLKTEVSAVFDRTDGAKWNKGILMYQDVVLNFRKPQLSLYLRVAYFDTDSYDERLYAYENDVYYAFTVGSYYYQGMRAYLMLRYKIQNFSIWLRISRTHYLNKETISSGLTEIDKPHKTEVKVQGMYRF